MTKIKQILLAGFFTFCTGPIFAQTFDSQSIFPNPFSISTTIHIEIVQSDTVTLSLLSAFGQTDKTFFQSSFLANGTCDLNLSGDSLANGIYFARFEIGSTKVLS
jgi:hypothetical protein